MQTKPRETTNQNPPEFLAQHCRAVRAVCGDGEAHSRSATSDVLEPDRDVLLSALRSAVIRAKLDANELQTIGIALRSHMISPEDAVAWLMDIGLVTQVIPDREVRQ